MSISFEKDIEMKDVQNVVHSNISEESRKAYAFLSDMSSTSSRKTKEEEKEEKTISVHSSIQNKISLSDTPSKSFGISPDLAKSIIFSYLELKFETENGETPEFIVAIIKQDAQKPFLKKWFYSTLYKILVKHVKKDYPDIKVDNIDKEIQTLYDNRNIDDLTIKDLFLYKYENGKKLLEGNNFELLQLLKNNQASTEVLNLLNKNYLTTFAYYMSKFFENFSKGNKTA